MAFSNCLKSESIRRVLVVLLCCAFGVASSQSKDSPMSESALRCELRGNE
jgi:hypothetical protein